MIERIVMMPPQRSDVQIRRHTPHEAKDTQQLDTKSRGRLRNEPQQRRHQDSAEENQSFARAVRDAGGLDDCSQIDGESDEKKSGKCSSSAANGDVKILPLRDSVRVQGAPMITAAR